MISAAARQRRAGQRGSGSRDPVGNRDAARLRAGCRARNAEVRHVRQRDNEPRSGSAVGASGRGAGKSGFSHPFSRDGKHASSLQPRDGRGAARAHLPAPMPP